MSKAGKRLLRGAYQALAYAEGRAEPDTYRVHFPDAAGAEASAQMTNLDDAESALDKSTAKETVPATGGNVDAVLKPQTASDSSGSGK